jgi:predicted esterase
MKWQEANFEFSLPVRYHLGPANKTGLVVLLHGYQDNAYSMLKRLSWAEQENLPFQIFASNAPFPVPVWTGSGFKEAYSWYFRDTSRGLTLVPPQTSAARVAGLLKDLGLENERKVIVGFSQGGYLAPYLAKATSNVRAIVGLGSGYTPEHYEDLNPISVYAIHGSEDKVIDLPRAQSDHAKLLARGFTGSFHVEPGLDHRVDPVLESRVRKLCLESLGS